MYQARPYGRFYKGKGDGLSDEDNAASELLMRRLTNLKGTSQLDAMKMARTLPSGAVAVAVDAGGTLRLMIYPPESAEDILESGISEDSIPMLFSGVIDKGLVGLEDKRVDVKISNTTVRRLSKYQQKQTVGKTHKLERFNVKIPSHLKFFTAGSPLSENMTQYFRIRPTWWSGAMSEVVQIVGGYGRQDLSELPDSEIERATFVLPNKVLQKAKLEMINRRLPGYFGKANKDGEFQYDFRCVKTNGVTFDSSGAPWLTQVSKAGVHAMPLPMIPITMTKAFKEYIEEVQDDEILWLIDRFGGMPSGESFPLDPKGFQSWLRAGVIIKVCDTADFYDHDEMSMSCGWSFNKNGTEGFNTATGFDESLKIPYCAAYKIKLSLGSVENRGILSLQKDLDNPHQDKINAYLSSLLRSIKNDGHKMRAIRYKIRRVPVSQILSKIKDSNSDGSNDVDYWDSLELEPIASHVGTCKRVSKGFIYPYSLANFKIPEPLFEGCISHNMLGLYDVDVPEKYPKCDTIIYGYYIGDDLKVVKYFSDERKLNKEVESDFEDCMTEGSWTKKEYLSPARIVGNIYTTDFDDREEISDNYRLTAVKSVDLGYPPHAQITQILSVFSMEFRVDRRRYYGKTTNVKMFSEKTKSMYAYIPFMSRNCLIYGTKEYESITNETETASRLFIQDPNVYFGWSYDAGARWWNWQSWMISPIPGDSAPPNPFWIEYMEYRNGIHCGSWADDGPWLNELPNDFSSVFNTGRSWHEEYFEIIGGGLRYTPKRPNFHEYTKKIEPKRDEKFENHASITGVPVKLSDKEVGYSYFERSPDSHNNYFYRDAIKIQAGSAIYASISDSSGRALQSRQRFGHTELADGKSAHHFIGVINE